MNVCAECISDQLTLAVLPKVIFIMIIIPCAYSKFLSTLFANSIYKQEFVESGKNY